MNRTKVRSPASMYSMMNRGESVNEKHLGIEVLMEDMDLH